MRIKYITHVKPAMLLLLIPTRMNPTCAMDEKARKRFIFCCLSANKFPTIIVAIASTTIILYHVSSAGWNTLNSADMNTKATAPFETTDKKEVAAIGEPSYTSAVHKWKGTIDNLKANAVNRKT